MNNMEYLIFGIFIGVCFVITWIVIACNAPKSDWDRFQDNHYKKLTMEPPIDFEKGQLRSENLRMREQICWLEKTRCPIKCMYENRHCAHCEPHNITIFAKTPDEQAIVDLVKEMGKPYDKIKKELGIK